MKYIQEMPLLGNQQVRGIISSGVMTVCTIACRFMSQHDSNMVGNIFFSSYFLFNSKYKCQNKSLYKTESVTK